LGCLSFGNDAAWKIELEESRAIIRKAIELGVNFFDTSNAYSSGRSEEIVGECLKDHRDDMVLATKVGLPMNDKPNNSGVSRRHIMQQIKGSLKRLQTDYVDLYQIHRLDYSTPFEETMRTLNDIVRMGMAHYIGASSMFAWQFLKMLSTSERLGLERFVSMQNHYNLMYREEEREMIPLCKSEGIALFPWSPLARGLLTGKYRRGETPKTVRYTSDKIVVDGHYVLPNYDIIEAVEGLAKEREVSMSQIALAWVLNKDVTAVTIGATRVSHVEEAVGALDIKLNADEMSRLEACYKPQPIIGHATNLNEFITRYK
jgi:aryl-alcohol dehydrogenase-like predicted oxidoreductase